MLTEQFTEHWTNLNPIENGIRNKFRWQWLEEKDCKWDYDGSLGIGVDGNKVTKCELKLI